MNCHIKTGGRVLETNTQTDRDTKRPITKHFFQTHGHGSVRLSIFPWLSVRSQSNEMRKTKCIVTFWESHCGAYPLKHLVLLVPHYWKNPGDATEREQCGFRYHDTRTLWVNRHLRQLATFAGKLHHLALAKLLQALRLRVQLVAQKIQCPTQVFPIYLVSPT